MTPDDVAFVLNVSTRILTSWDVPNGLRPVQPGRGPISRLYLASDIWDLMPERVATRLRNQIQYQLPGPVLNGPFSLLAAGEASWTSGASVDTLKEWGDANVVSKIALPGGRRRYVMAEMEKMSKLPANLRAPMLVRGLARRLDRDSGKLLRDLRAAGVPIIVGDRVRRNYVSMLDFRQFFIDEVYKD
jgi:hypothetical protein